MLNQKNVTNSLRKKTGTGLGAIALGLMALVLPACDNPQEISEGQDNVTTEDVTAEETTADTETSIGEEVTIRSQVEQTVGETGFVMLPEDGDESILVINSTGTPFTLPQQDIPVQATGTVEQFVIADIESEYGLDLEEELYVDYENQPAIIADSLALAPTPEELATNPELYYDQVIAVKGEARGIYSPNTFSLFEQGWVDDIGLLVTGVNQDLEAQDSDVQEGELVVVTGVARPFNVNILQEENAGLDDEEVSEFETRYTERPVIVADDVYPSAVDVE